MINIYHFQNKAEYSEEIEQLGYNSLDETRRTLFHTTLLN